MDRNNLRMEDYLDYDDFGANSRGGGGSSNSGVKVGRKRGGKSGSASNDTGSGTIYNSKHIRIGEAKRGNVASDNGAKGKGKKGKNKK
jgi:hypothetical protein